MVNRSRNMRRNRSRGRTKRGGGFMDFFKSSPQDLKNVPDAQVAPGNSSYLPDISSALGSAEGVVSSALGTTEEGLTNLSNKGTELLSSVTNLIPGQAAAATAPTAPAAPGPAPGPGPGSAQGSVGGYKRSKQMRMKGGKSLGLDYYATSVNGIKVAQPTYMEYYKGGKRSSKRSSKRRKTKRRSHGKKRRSCRRRR